MATYTPDTCHAPSRTAHGIACVLLGMVLFVGQDAFMKTLLQTYPIWMLMFVRSSVAVLVLVPLLAVLIGDVSTVPYGRTGGVGNSSLALSSWTLTVL